MEKTEAQRLTPATLAFIGDAVHTLYIRKKIAAEHTSTAGTLHVEATGFCNAKAQAAAFDALETADELTDEEREIARRAKNAHLHSRAKTASPSDYHKATALEAILGYLELIGDRARQETIFNILYSRGE